MNNERLIQKLFNPGLMQHDWHMSIDKPFENSVNSLPAILSDLDLRDMKNVLNHEKSHKTRNGSIIMGKLKLLHN